MKGVIAQTGIDFKEKTVLDVGSSHGGFVHMSLVMGAGMVYAVDVGKGLLEWKLRQLPQVIVMEGVNARTLKKEQFGTIPDIGLVDVSFISLRKVLPVIFKIVKEEVLALLKPQFEATRKEASKGKGVISDRTIQLRVIADIKKSVEDADWKFSGVYPSEVKGRKGNQEYFLHYERI